MFASTLLLAASALAVGLVDALNYSTSGPLNVTASQIPLSMRNIWCGAQHTTCLELCDQSTKINYCDPTDLAYQCTCSDKSLKPNISAYMQTLPFYICETWVANCVDNHPNDYDGIAQCRSVVCGDKNASASASSASSSSSASSAASTSASSTGSSGGSGGQSSSSSTSSSFAAATKFASAYGTQILAGGMLAAFGLAL